MNGLHAPVYFSFSILDTFVRRVGRNEKVDYVAVTSQPPFCVMYHITGRLQSHHRGFFGLPGHQCTKAAYGSALMKCHRVACQFKPSEGRCNLYWVVRGEIISVCLHLSFLHVRCSLFRHLGVNPHRGLQEVVVSVLNGLPVDLQDGRDGR